MWLERLLGWTFGLMFCLIMHYFRDDRVEQEYFGLCEVEVFDYKSKYYLEID